jgi:L-threonylcarbamoyladenylate synthase
MKNPDIFLIADLLKNGGIAVLPAGTVYGLFCSAFSKAGIKKIYKVKGRSFEKPLQIFLPCLEEISEYAAITDGTKKKIRAYLPGPYTVVLKLRKKHHATFPFLKAGTAGFRVAGKGILNEIMVQLGAPLASTSANISGEATPVKFSSITRKILQKADYSIKNDALIKGKASSVIDMTSGKEKILRK